MLFDLRWMICSIGSFVSEIGIVPDKRQLNKSILFVYAEKKKTRKTNKRKLKSADLINSKGKEEAYVYKFTLARPAY